MAFTKKAYTQGKKNSKSCNYFSIKWLKLSLFVCLGALCTQKSQAKAYISSEYVDVYKKPNEDSDVLKEVQVGQKIILIKHNKSKTWWRINFYLDGKKTKGYIPYEKGISTIENHKRDNPLVVSRQGQKSLSLALIGGLYTQSERDFTTQFFGSGKVFRTISFSTYFEFKYEHPVGESSFVRFSVGNKSFDLKGSTELGIPDSGTNPIEINQRFLMVGSALVFYKEGASYWSGFGLDYLMGKSVKIILDDSTPVATTKDDIANFVALTYISGMDVKLSDNLFLTPEFKLSMLINAKPVILGAEGHLGLSWLF